MKKFISILLLCISLNINAQDTIPPVVITNNLTVTLVNGIASITISQVNNGSYDNYSISYMFLSKQYFTCEDIGLNTIILTVVDESGNVGTNTAIVNVTGTINNPITIAANTSTIYLDYQNSATITANGGSSYLWSTGETTNTITVSPTSTTTYSVIENNPSACIQSSASITINVVDVRCEKNKVKLCHNNNEICISKSAVATHLAHGDKLGSCQTTARNQFTNAVETFNVYPNPSKGSFNITLSNPNGILRVHTPLGKVVYQKLIISKNTLVNLPNSISSGTYYVIIQDGINLYCKTINVIK